MYTLYLTPNAVYVCAYCNNKKHNVLCKTMSKASFRLPDVVKHFFQPGSAAENERNANRL